MAAKSLPDPRAKFPCPVFPSGSLKLVHEFCRHYFWPARIRTCLALSLPGFGSAPLGSSRSRFPLLLQRHGSHSLWLPFVASPHGPDSPPMAGQLDRRYPRLVRGHSFCGSQCPLAAPICVSLVGVGVFWKRSVTWSRRFSVERFLPFALTASLLVSAPRCYFSPRPAICFGACGALAPPSTRADASATPLSHFLSCYCDLGAKGVR